MTRIKQIKEKVPLKPVAWILSVFLLTVFFSFSAPTIKFALLKYKGGGDWYNDVNSLKNLAQFCNKNLGTNFDLDHATVEPGSPDLFNYPFVYMTGHGNFTLTTDEAANIRAYLVSGGFLFINDDYGLDPYVRPTMKKFFQNWTLWRFPSRIPFTTRNTISPTAFPRFTNTITSRRRHSVYSTREDWFASMIMKAIWAMGGMMYTTIRKKCVSRRCRWGQTSFSMYSL